MYYIWDSTACPHIISSYPDFYRVIAGCAPRIIFLSKRMICEVRAVITFEALPLILMPEKFLKLSFGKRKGIRSVENTAS